MIFVLKNKYIIFVVPFMQNGTLTEWLGSGLQNRVQQFESAGYLTHERAHHQLGDVLSFRISANFIISTILLL